MTELFAEERKVLPTWAVHREDILKLDEWAAQRMLVDVVDEMVTWGQRLVEYEREYREAKVNVSACREMGDREGLRQWGPILAEKAPAYMEASSALGVLKEVKSLLQSLLRSLRAAARDGP